MSTYFGTVVMSPNSKIVRVRVPRYHGGIPDHKLPVANVSTAAGITPKFKNGTRVLVSLGDLNLSTPTIIGVVSDTNGNQNIDMEANISDLNVSKVTELNQNISIVGFNDGKEDFTITGENLACLRNLKKNVVQQFIETDNSISNLKDTLDEHKSNSSEHILDGVANISKLVANSTNQLVVSELPSEAQDGQIVFLISN